MINDMVYYITSNNLKIVSNFNRFFFANKDRSLIKRWFLEDLNIKLKYILSKER